MDTGLIRFLHMTSDHRLILRFGVHGASTKERGLGERKEPGQQIRHSDPRRAAPRAVFLGWLLVRWAVSVRDGVYTHRAGGGRGVCGHD